MRQHRHWLLRHRSNAPRFQILQAALALQKPNTNSCFFFVKRLACQDSFAQGLKKLGQDSDADACDAAHMAGPQSHLWGKRGEKKVWRQRVFASRRVHCLFLCLFLGYLRRTRRWPLSGCRCAARGRIAAVRPRSGWAPRAPCMRQKGSTSCSFGRECCVRCVLLIKNKETRYTANSTFFWRRPSCLSLLSCSCPFARGHSPCRYFRIIVILIGSCPFWSTTLLIRTLWEATAVTILALSQKHLFFVIKATQVMFPVSSSLSWFSLFQVLS